MFGIYGICEIKLPCAPNRILGIYSIELIDMIRMVQRGFRVSLPRRLCRLLAIREGGMVMLLFRPQNPLQPRQTTLDEYQAHQSFAKSILSRIRRG
jgi:hypothetical protein